MSKIGQLVEELRDRLNSVADQEQKLVSSLRDALNRFDQKLLQDVRSVAAEHEARRSHILSELQDLASRIGVFPSASTGPRPQVSGDFRAGASEPVASGEASLTNRLRAVEGGAWHEATEKLQNELGSHFRKRA
jgi:hypothetical protein